MQVFIKKNRFTGNYFRWEELGGVSKGCTEPHCNGLKMLQPEVEEFEYLLGRKQESCLGAGGQYEYRILDEGK